eukprot:TRINITY_DN767_c0_g1_i2.p1 TRINITY_DN767_c0_g1~~TRINITY_DN767_c0_g1_i2.p1  ORF type:complete len:245 (-),score=38.11 TRINITY_DN767_c0_g1_i2:60-794(-)
MDWVTPICGLVAHLVSTMGGTHTIEKHVTDPKLVAELAEMRKIVDELNAKNGELLADLEDKLRKADEEAERRGDPDHYLAEEQSTFELFLSRLPKLTLKDIIPRRTPDERCFIFLGQISSGKTSLLNSLFAAKLLVGLGDTTAEVRPVLCDAATRRVIYDAPGDSTKFKYLNPTHLAFLHSVDTCFILCDSSLSTIERIVRTVAAVKKNGKPPNAHQGIARHPPDEVRQLGCVARPDAGGGARP